MRMMLGSARSQVGWLLLIAGTFVFWVLVWYADISAWRFQFAHLGRATGRFLYCRETQPHVRSSRRRTRQIYEYHYQYEILGRVFEGCSYAESCPGGRRPVEYLMGHPEISRTVGMRRNLFSQWVALMAAIPAFGIFLILSAAAEGLTRVRLLRDGLPALGRLVDVTRTNIQRRKRQVYKLTLEYTAQSGATGRVTARSISPENFEDKAATPLFYDPANLKRAVVIATLPGAISPDASGQPVARASRAYLFLPAAIVLANVWIVYGHWFAKP
jgi:hypothetical protein